MTELDVLDMCNNKDGIEYIIAADYCLSEINNCQPPDPKAVKLIIYSLRDRPN